MKANERNVVRVKKVPRKKENPEDIIATFCYYFPQYKYHEAKKLPYRRIKQMLRVAKKETARQNYYLTRIISAPHAKNASSAIKKLLEDFSGIIKE